MPGFPAVLGKCQSPAHAGGAAPVSPGPRACPASIAVRSSDTACLPMLCPSPLLPQGKLCQAPPSDALRGCQGLEELSKVFSGAWLTRGRAGKQTRVSVPKATMLTQHVSFSAWQPQKPCPVGPWPQGAVSESGHSVGKGGGCQGQGSLAVTQEPGALLVPNSSSLPASEPCTQSWGMVLRR